MIESFVGCLSELRAIQVVAAELNAIELARSRTHAAGCAQCSELLGEITENRRTFASPPTFLSCDANRGSPHHARRAWIAAAGAVLAAAGAVFVLAPGSDDRGDPPPGERSKGGRALRFGVFVKRGDSVRRAGDGEPVRLGDQLRFELASPVGWHVAVLSLDGRGTASVYYPQAAVTVPRAAGAADVLDVAIELDAAWGREVLHAVACPSPIDLARLRSGLEQRGTLQLAAGCASDRVDLVKEVP